MNKKFKAFISAGISAVMLLGAVQTGFAYYDTSKGFNTNRNDTQVTYCEIKDSEDSVAEITATPKVSGGAGKEKYDTGYRAVVDVPAGYSGAAGFNFTDEISGGMGDEERVWAFSLRYSEGTEKVGVLAFGEGIYEDDLVTLENGSVKVNGTETGIKAVPGQWYRIVVVFSKTVADIRVYVNGQGFEPFTGNTNTLTSLTWTRIAMMPTAAESGESREMSIDIDYLDIFQTVKYDPSMQAQATYEIAASETIKYDADEKTLTVPEGTKVSKVTAAVTATDEKYTNKKGEEANVTSAVCVCPNLWDIGQRGEEDEVQDGDILVVTASDTALASLEYLTIKVKEAPEPMGPTYEGAVKKITEGNAVGFYGTCKTTAADQAFGFTVEYDNKTSEIEYSGTVVGEVMFGLIIDNVPEDENIMATFLQ